MPKLTIIPEDRVVHDGADRAPAWLPSESFSGVPENVHALQWDDEKERGEIEFEPGDEHPENEKITALPAWAQTLREEAANA